MEKTICPQCGNATQTGTLRCPRCNKLLLAPCSGNCSRCQQKDGCKT